MPNFVAKTIYSYYYELLLLLLLLSLLLSLFIFFKMYSTSAVMSFSSGASSDVRDRRQEKQTCVVLPNETDAYFIFRE